MQEVLREHNRIAIIGDPPDAQLNVCKMGTIVQVHHVKQPSRLVLTPMVKQRPSRLLHPRHIHPVTGTEMTHARELRSTGRFGTLT